MSDNELIYRGDVLAKAYHHPVEGGLIISAYDVEHIPAVPREMSAKEYIREYRRMCDFYFGKPATDGGCDGCGDCPGRLNGNKNCIFSPTRDESSIPIIEKWAREHPEEVNNE